MYCVEESKDQVQLVLQHFFFFASKRILQQFCWQEFSKTLRLLRRLDFSYWPWRWRFEGRVGRGSIFTIPCFPRYSARAILAKIIEKKKSLFQSTIYWGDSPSHLDLDRVVLSSQRILFLYSWAYTNQTSLYKIAQVCTTYNRSKVWGPVGCNCQKFVLEVLDRLNLRFAPEAFIDRINQGDYDLTIADPECLQTVFNSVLELDGFAEDHWNHLLPWSKYLLFTYNSISSEWAQNHARGHASDAATT